MQTFEIIYCLGDEWMQTMMIEAYNWIDARKKFMKSKNISYISQCSYYIEFSLFEDIQNDWHLSPQKFELKLLDQVLTKLFIADEKCRTVNLNEEELKQIMAEDNVTKSQINKLMWSFNQPINLQSENQKINIWLFEKYTYQTDQNDNVIKLVITCAPEARKYFFS